ncbi:MAG: hypothetical protein IPO21_13730, partial [Bacteroidales bacterium]|nr:hypothetical protein [Bacteroidales bacterium]
MNINTAHVFPAFTLKYTGKEMQVLEINNVDFNSKLQYASEIIGINLTDFDFNTNNFIEQEEKNQYLSFLFSCCFSEIVKSKQA